MTYRAFAGSSPTLSILKLSSPEKGAALRRRAGHFEGTTGVEKVVDRILPVIDGAGVRCPRLRERVHVDGHTDSYFVVYVDQVRHVADLVCAHRVGFLLDQVPFSAIRSAELNPE